MAKRGKRKGQKKGSDSTQPQPHERDTQEAREAQELADDEAGLHLADEEGGRDEADQNDAGETVEATDDTAPGGRRSSREAEESALTAAAVSIGEGLGTFLAQAEQQFRSWHTQREAFVVQLRQIRDRATQMLHEAGETVGLDVPGPRRPGRPRREEQPAEGVDLPPATEGRGRRGKKRGMSDEGRRRIAEAQRARWARSKSGKQE